MGNEQSAPTPRRPTNKLSKPRTNNHSNPNLLDRRASAPASRRNSISTNDSPIKTRDSAILVDALGAQAVEGRKEQRTRKRMSLFRSKSAKPQSRLEETNTDLDRSSVEPSPIEPTHRWSRAPRVRGNSATTQSSVEPSLNDLPLKWSSDPRIRRNSVTTQSSSRSSERPYSEPPTGLTKPPIRSRMSLHTYAHHPRLSLVAELPSPQPDRADTIKRLSRYEQEDVSPGALTQASRTNSESALYAPIRRRSLLQHGVATRTSFAESDPRSSLPSQSPRDEIPAPKPVSSQNHSEDMRDYYYNTSKPTSSPLSDLAMLGPNPEFAGIGPRTETPTELEHIGTFKLGTLRITNGAASPVPSFRSAEDDYISAGNARKSQESNHGPGHRSNTLSVPAETRKTPWVVRSESPLRQTHELEHKPLTIETQIPFSEPFSWFNFEKTEKLLKSTESPTKASELAKEYQQDLALSPFSFDNSPLPSPKLESTSKNTAIEDDLFEAEPATPNLSERTPRSFDSAYDNGFSLPRKPLKGPRDLPPKALAKADSGYSSNISLRSFKRDSVHEELPPTPPKESSIRIPSSSYSVASTESDITLRMKRSLPSLPAEKPAPPPPMREAPPVPLTRASTYNYNKDVPSPPLPEKDNRGQAHLSVPSQHIRQKSMPNVQARNIREESPANSEISATSSGSSSRWTSKAKIGKRPQSTQPPKPEPVFTVQAFRSPSEHLRIPPPSEEARRHLEQRVDAFPVACFPNTYSGNVGLRHSSSKETLQTIFSVGSAEVRDELNFARLQSALPPVPTQPSIPEYPIKTLHKPDFNRRNTLQVAPPVPVSVPDREQRESRSGRKSVQSRASRDRSLPRLPRKAVSNEDMEEHLTSYSTISSSLGKSPYELAASTIPKPSTVNERAKSMTAQFEADAAARFNLTRANSQTPQQLIKPESISRIRSYDSIAAGNPFASTNTSRRSSREQHPPQAHSNNSPWRSYSASSQQQQLPLQVPQSQNPLAAHPPQLFSAQQQQRFSPSEDEKRHSNVSTGSKTRSPPPVSMTTQRKLLPTQLGAHQVIPPSRTPPLPAGQEPARPPRSSPVEKHGNGNGWTGAENVWKERRQSAGEALHTRPSMELRRPTQELRGRQSMDGSRAQQERSLSQQRGLSGRGSYDNSQGVGLGLGKMQTQGWNVGVGYEDAHAYPSPPRKPVRSWTLDARQEYDHTYGSSSKHYDKENSNEVQNGEYEYYDPSNQSYQIDAQLSSSLHQQNSTSEMLVLDRFSGGLGYGYERGEGLVGSAGTRNVGKMEPRGGNRGKSGLVAERWGVDLSDVPVILRRVAVEN